jgi:HD superfamily phosphohydrolase YqeK
MYDKYRDHFLKMYEHATDNHRRTFPHHVMVVTKWAEKLCDLYPEADREVAVIASLFHDLGHFIDGDTDHAIKSEIAAKAFLEKEKMPAVKINKILHAVRAHRNKDVKPNTLEAKIVCFADSASHMAAEVYLNILADNSKADTLAKIERDYRDLSDFPEVKQELEPLYHAWKNIILSFPDDFIELLPK